MRVNCKCGPKAQMSLNKVNRACRKTVRVVSALCNMSHINSNTRELRHVSNYITLGM